MADNIHVKLAKMRVELQKMNIKKSGHNPYSNYDYYELADILPPINDLQVKYKTCSYITFNSDVATLTLVNAEEPSEQWNFTSPMAEISLKAANAIQNLGGVETYQRRYLYMTAFEIVENDYFDATQGKQEQSKQGQNKQEQKNSKPKSRPKALISEATANELNMKIKECASVSGVAVVEVSNWIRSTIGKNLGEIDENDAKAIMNLLETRTKEMEAI